MSSNDTFTHQASASAASFLGAPASRVSLDSRIMLEPLAAVAHQDGAGSVPQTPNSLNWDVISHSSFHSSSSAAGESESSLEVDPRTGLDHYLSSVSELFRLERQEAERRMRLCERIISAASRPGVADEAVDEAVQSLLTLGVGDNKRLRHNASEIARLTGEASSSDHTDSQAYAICLESAGNLIFNHRQRLGAYDEVSTHSGLVDDIKDWFDLYIENFPLEKESDLLLIGNDDDEEDGIQDLRAAGGRV